MSTITGSSVIVIPARMDSRRLPGKPMLEAGGKPLVHWTHDRAIGTGADSVVVTSPDRAISNYCRDNKIPFWWSSSDHATGTHRCASYQRFLSKWSTDVVVNWQVDAPLVDPADVDRLIAAVQANGTICTLVSLIKAWESNVGLPVCDCVGWRHDPNVTKVAVGETGRCMWFSRATMAGAMAHSGVYAYPAGTLAALGRLKPTPLSEAESLEQLAWIEAGYAIQSVEIGELPLSIDTATDWDRFKRMVEE